MLAVAALKLNTGLRELYLSDNDLGLMDAIQLGGLLRSNFALQLLDIRCVQWFLSLLVFHCPKFLLKLHATQ
jgi:hypothetical protein